MYSKRKVLDKGFITLTGLLGNDVTAIKIYGNHISNTEHLKTTLTKLLRTGKCTFEHATLQFHIKCPLFIKDKWIKHRLSSYTEIVSPYPKPDFYIPTHFRKYGNTGSVEDMNEGECNQLYSKFDNFYTWISNFYGKLISRHDLVKEQAGFIFPESRYIEFYWTVNLRSLMNFLRGHMKDDSNYEMKQYSNILFDFFAQNFPLTAEVFTKQNIDGTQIGGHVELL